MLALESLPQLGPGYSGAWLGGGLLLGQQWLTRETQAHGQGRLACGRAFEQFASSNQPGRTVFDGVEGGQRESALFEVRLSKEKKRKNLADERGEKRLEGLEK